MMLRSVVLIVALVSSAEAVPCEEAQPLLARWSADIAVLNAAMQKDLEAFPTQDAKRLCCRALTDDLRAKQRTSAVLGTDELLQHAVRYERFRVETFLSAGISPKRYFGFFDEQGDTAAHERVLRQTIIEAVRIINEYARTKKLRVRVTEKEIAVTFLAEGGALLLTERQSYLERVHPVRGIGLDSFREGFEAHKELVATLDAQLGTRLGKLTWDIGGWSVLLRPMTFREAVLGTAVMYLFEKELTAKLRAGQSLPALATLDLDRQFVVTSLVYNSGLLFSDERIEQMIHRETGLYLAEVNKLNRGKRPELDVPPAFEPARWLLTREPLPQQLTSWNAVYHVMQRYGAWVALAQFSTVFDAEGRFTAR
jgi:hypothetical protein